ncbi:hypothetical protein Tco_0398616, partial [Tanacetum coccineum]
MEGPMIIEAEIGRHFVHRMYVDGGASSEVLYEHCFIRLRLKIRSQMIPATTFVTHRIQWRNHLVDRLDIPTSKDRWRRAFHFRIDKLHGYQ